MGSSADEAKGRIKEAAGDLTGDESLEREGKLDQAGAKVKEKVENAKEKVDSMVESVKERHSDGD